METFHYFSQNTMVMNTGEMTINLLSASGAIWFIFIRDLTIWGQEQHRTDCLFFHIISHKKSWGFTGLTGVFALGSHWWWLCLRARWVISEQCQHWSEDSAWEMWILQTGGWQFLFFPREGRRRPARWLEVYRDELFLHNCPKERTEYLPKKRTKPANLHIRGILNEIL